MQILRPIVQTVESVPRRVRDLARLREVAGVFAKHGYGVLVAGLDLPGVPRSDTAAEPLPSRLVSAFQELGPTFVKLGQVLSTRPDLLAPPWIEALQTLQDDASVLPAHVIHEQLARELGPDWRDRFGSLDDTPLATASIAQVHAGTLPDGRDVVVKVQRPGLARKIQADLSILHVLAERLRVEFPELASVDIDGALGEFERSILAELDFEVEAGNQEAVRAIFADHEGVAVPEVHRALSTRHVLTMERLRGVKIRDARDAGHDMARVGERYLGAAFDMLFVHGFFHGDLHPGNVLVLPGDVVGLLDFGMMGRLTEQMKSDVLFIIFAVQRGDIRTVARICYDLGIKTRRVDYAAMERDTAAIVDRHWKGGNVADMDLGPFVMDLMRVASAHGARIPSDLTMFFKALVTTEGLAKSIIPEIDPLAAAAPYVERMLRERLDLSRMQGDALYYALTLSSLSRRLPVTLSQLLDDVDAQRVRFDIRQVVHPETAWREDRRWALLSASLVFGACALAGTLALAVDAAWVGSVPVVSVGFGAIGLFVGRAAWRLAGGRVPEPPVR